MVPQFLHSSRCASLRFFANANHSRLSLLLGLFPRLRPTPFHHLLCRINKVDGELPILAHLGERIDFLFQIVRVVAFSYPHNELSSL